MKQKVQVIMLATTIEKATYPKSLMKCIQSYDGGWIDNFHNKVDKGELFYGFSDLTQGIWELQHLYFTLNEEIKEGDLVLMNLRNDSDDDDWFAIDKVVEIENNYMYFSNSGVSTSLHKATKIVATTDKSLNLPLIPESFIKEFVESNGSIKEVEIERKVCKRHEKIVTNVDYPCTCLGTLQPLKVNSNNEVIICKEEKDTFTREDLEKSFNAGCDYYSEGFAPNFEQWFKQNF